jgi:hypothetical protein
VKGVNTKEISAYRLPTSLFDQTKKREINIAESGSSLVFQSLDTKASYLTLAPECLLSKPRARHFNGLITMLK